MVWCGMLSFVFFFFFRLLLIEGTTSGRFVFSMRRQKEKKEWRGKTEQRKQGREGINGMCFMHRNSRQQSRIIRIFLVGWGGAVCVFLCWVLGLVYLYNSRRDLWHEAWLKRRNDVAKGEGDFVFSSVLLDVVFWYTYNRAGVFGALLWPSPLKAYRVVCPLCGVV